jgi:hypothetical protein
MPQGRWVMNKYGNRFSQIHGCAAAKAQNAIVTTITISQGSAARGCLRGIELGIEKYIKPLWQVGCDLLK